MELSQHDNPVPGDAWRDPNAMPGRTKTDLDRAGAAWLQRDTEKAAVTMPPDRRLHDAALARGWRLLHLRPVFHHSTIPPSQLVRVLLWRDEREAIPEGAL